MKSFELVFNAILDKCSRPMNIERHGAGAFPETPIKVAKSNYFKQNTIIETEFIENREWVISKKVLTAAGLGPPKGTDRLYDPEFGMMMIKEVELMTAPDGNILGYRVKVS